MGEGKEGWRRGRRRGKGGREDAGESSNAPNANFGRTSYAFLESAPNLPARRGRANANLRSKLASLSQRMQSNLHANFHRIHELQITFGEHLPIAHEASNTSFPRS